MAKRTTEGSTANTASSDQQPIQTPTSGRIEYDAERMQGPRFGVVAPRDPNAGGNDTADSGEDERPMIDASQQLGPELRRQQAPDPEPDSEPEDGGKGADPRVRTLTQSELDAIIEARLKRERNKYADYDELKTRVEEIDGQTRSEAERTKAEIEQLRQEREQLAEKNRRLVIQQAIGNEASKLGLDLKAAIKLADLDMLEFDPDTGEVLNASEVVKDVAEQYPALILRRGPVPTTRPANPDRSQQIPTGRTDDDRRRDYFGGRTGTFWQGGGVVRPVNSEA